MSQKTKALCHKIDELIAFVEGDKHPMQRVIQTKIVVDGYKFGHIFLNKNQIIGHTSLSYASVNLKPITQGHVLVMTKRVVPRVSMLSFDELGDLWYLAQQMSIVLEEKHKAKSITFAIQDGKYAGQTIDHVHIHVISRFPKDYEKNDDVYVELEKDAPSYVQSIGVDDDKRKMQTMEEMTNDAMTYKEIINRINGM
eukprot:349970_1